MSTAQLANNTSNGQQPLQRLPSLWVGDLPADVNEAHLFEIFRPCGKILSIRVCRDAVTRRSLGYAYVNFETRSEAERAMNEMQSTQIGEETMRICWSQRDPTIRKSGVGNIFIKNLDPSIDNKALNETFENFGKILSAKVQYYEKNGVPVSKGFGFVHFAEQEAADKAIEKMNGLKLNGRKVYVGPFVKKSERNTTPIESIFTNVFVKNLPKDWTDEKLTKFFGEVGEVQHATVMVDENKQSLEYGFCNFVKHEDAVKAIETLNNKEVDGKPLYVSRFKSKDEREKELKQKREQQQEKSLKQGTNLYVRNFVDSMDEGKLKELFEEFGEIESVKVMRDPKTKNSRGFGFVSFVKPEDAQNAMTSLNGKMLSNKPLFVALAQDKEARRLQMEAQFRMRSARAMPMMGRGQMMGAFPGHMQGYSAPPMAYGQPMVPNAWAKPLQQGQQRPMPVDLSFLKKLPHEQAIQEIGNRIFPLIQAIDPTNAPKITGMILELPSLDELITLAQSQEELHERVVEAQRVLSNE